MYISWINLDHDCQYTLAITLSGYLQIVQDCYATG